MNTVPAVIPTTGAQFPLIHSVQFDSDCVRFAVAHQAGFRFYTVLPLVLGYCKEDHGLGQVSAVRAISFKDDLVAFVGAHTQDGSFDEKVIVFDITTQQPLCSLAMLEPVYNVLVIPEFLIVVLAHKIMVYELGACPRLHASYDTTRNEGGIAAVAALRDGGHVLAFPARLPGQVQIVDLAVLDANHRSTVRIVKAHQTLLQHMCLSHGASMMATASVAGTLIRVHCCTTGTLVHEFRRGLDHAAICSMRFSPCDGRLAVVSDKGTLHVFSLDELRGGPRNRRHLLVAARLGFAVPAYFQSAWSFCSVNTARNHARFAQYPSGDTATVGWSGSDRVLLVWHQKHLFEQYTVRKGANATWSITRTSWQVLRRHKMSLA